MSLFKCSFIGPGGEFAIQYFAADTIPLLEAQAFKFAYENRLEMQGWQYYGSTAVELPMCQFWQVLDLDKSPRYILLPANYEISEAIAFIKQGQLDFKGVVLPCDFGEVPIKVARKLHPSVSDRIIGNAFEEVA